MTRIPVPQEGIETLFGPFDENLKFLEALLGVQIRTHGHELLVDGAPKDVNKVERLIAQLTSLFREGFTISNGDVKTASQLVAQDENVDLRDYFPKGGQPQSGKRRIVPKSFNQRKYL